VGRLEVSWFALWKNRRKLGQIPRIDGKIR